MKTYYPSFYNSFKCLASSCPDTCCGTWELPVDEKSKEFFDTLDTPFGERIRNSIIKDADGDDVFRLVGGRCPFLDSDNLCEIRKKLGHSHTCEVCRQHPDFIEEYDDFTEIMPSLSCPAAVGHILAPDCTYPLHETESTDEWLVFLCKLRNRLFQSQSENTAFIPFAESCVNTVYRAENEFSESYGGDDLPFEINEEEFVFTPDEMLHYYREITGLFRRLEILTGEWKSILDRADAADDETVLSAVDDMTEEDLYVFLYLVFRYFLKAVNGYSAAALIRLIVFAVVTLRAYSKVCTLSFCETVRLASKETEHNPDNIFAFAEYFL